MDWTARAPTSLAVALPYSVRRAVGSRYTCDHLEVTFERTGERRYAVRIVAPGQAALYANPAPGYDDHIPHDLVHYLVEAELQLKAGVFGRAAQGGSSFVVAAEGASARERTREQRRQRKREAGLNKRDAEKSGDMVRAERIALLCDVAWRRRHGQRGDSTPWLPPCLLRPRKHRWSSVSSPGSRKSRSSGVACRSEASCPSCGPRCGLSRPCPRTEISLQSRGLEKFGCRWHLRAYLLPRRRTMTPGGAFDAVADEVSLKALFERMIAAWNVGSGEGFAAPFGEDADFVAFEGTHLRGRASIAAFHGHLFATHMKGSHLEGEVQFVRPLSSTFAVVHGYVRVILPHDTRALPSRDSMQLFVGERTAAGWHFDAALNARRVPLDRQVWWDQLEAVPPEVQGAVTEHVAQIANDRATGPSKFLRASALVLCALSLTMTSAHVLEIGGMYTILGLVAAWTLAVSARKIPEIFRKASMAAVLLSCAFASWLFLVLPVNRRVAALAATDPAAMPALWSALRPRWEYGHLTGFILTLLGFCALAAAVVGDAWNTQRRSVSDVTGPVGI